jgi:hypothetical protein
VLLETDQSLRGSRLTDASGALDERFQSLSDVVTIERITIEAAQRSHAAVWGGGFGGDRRDIHGVTFNKRFMRIGPQQISGCSERYVAAILEADAARMTIRISDARVAINERRNSFVKITVLDQEAIKAAVQKLATMKVHHVELIKQTASTGDTVPS